MDWHNYFYPFIALVGVLCLIFALAWVFRRLNHPQLALRNKQKKIKVLEIRQIDPKSKIIELNWEDKNLLVAMNDHAILLLAKKDIPTKDPKNFNDI